jgi:hypothetical protein
VSSPIHREKQKGPAEASPSWKSVCYASVATSSGTPGPKVVESDPFWM